MARNIELYNQDRSLYVEVAPDNGGMVTQIRKNKKEILHLDPQMLELSPMSAGGNPILFPFASKTRGDCYVLEGKTYGMPMHGLVKNAAWGIKECAENRITLWIESNSGWQESQFPFPFHMEVTYEVKDNCVAFDAFVRNDSERPMPHYFGWHPYFKASDKSRVYLQHHMTTHYDYVNCKDMEIPKELRLDQWWDDVFHTPTLNEFVLTNEADEYQVRCVCDETFQAMVVCTWVNHSVCIEPWCGIPDGIHQERFVRWLQPGVTEQCRMTWEISELFGNNM